ncbi:MAG: hypothetical protein WCG25_10120 [bacterium]
MYKISFDQRKLNVWNIANINAGLTSRFMVPDQKLPDQKPSINRVNSDYARSTNEVMENYKKAFIEAGI